MIKFKLINSITNIKQNYQPTHIHYYFITNFNILEYKIINC